MTEQAAKLIEWQKELNGIKQKFLVMSLKFLMMIAHAQPSLAPRCLQSSVRLTIFVFPPNSFCPTFFLRLCFLSCHHCIWTRYNFLIGFMMFHAFPSTIFCDFFLCSSMLHFICICSWRRFYRVERPALQMRMPRVRVKYKVKNVFVSRVIFFSTNDRRRLT